MNREVPKEQQTPHSNDHILMRFAYENLQSMGWIPPHAEISNPSAPAGIPRANEPSSGEVSSGVALRPAGGCA